MTIFSFLFFTLLVVIAVSIVVIYNAMVKGDNLVQEAWHGIDVQLKRRYDLIPNLIETVRGYTKHEKATLEDIVKLRNSYQKADNVDEKAQNSAELSGMLKYLFALSENYPDLKSNQNFIEMQKSLEKIEEDLQQARRYYNATVRHYNILVTIFPLNLLAAQFNFTKKDYFQIDNDSERENVKVSF